MIALTSIPHCWLKSVRPAADQLDQNSPLFSLALEQILRCPQIPRRTEYLSCIPNFINNKIRLNAPLSMLMSKL